MKETIKHQPVAPSSSIVQGDKWRITVLLDGLIRFEWSETGQFEDRASTFAVNRDLPTPKFEVVERDNQIEIITDRVYIEYDRKAFSPSGLSVTLRANARYYNIIWRYGQKLENLGGTTRTLDFVDGRTALWDGVLSKDGMAVLDDTESMLFTSKGWIATREQGTKDLYLFAYGKDYHQALKAFYDVSGHCPILPRWCLGNWWSRYYPYSQDEYIGLMDRFKDEKIPLSVAVIDMDWHVVEVDEKYGTGWTGWTWNRKLFPDHVKFLKQLHDRALKTTLNTHPSDGIRAYEAIYPDMCKALGRDPTAGHTISFDPTDPKFLDCYFNILHRSLEKDGVDFFWPDWQQGEISKLAGADPLFMLTHFHFLDHVKEGNRPMGFSRYIGPGGQRYPIGFSGDTVITWDSLKYQPEFTATAPNVGFGWWSHDVGGHHQGYKDEELYARWVQVGLWSPILRLHCSTGIFYAREPWRYNAETRDAATRALRFRHRLVPYLYTMATRSAIEGHSLVEPMYYDNPHTEMAYKYRNTFKFGTQLLVAPVTTPRNKDTTFAVTPAWVPPGRHVDLFTSTVYDGDRTISFHRPLDKIPVLAKEGAIVPLDASDNLENGCPLPAKLEILLVIGADGQFELVEDDGSGESIDRIDFSKTLITYSHEKGQLVIGPSSHALVAERHWSVRLLAYTPDPSKVKATSGGQPLPVQVSNPVQTADPHGWLIDLGVLSASQSTTVDLGEAQPQLDKRGVTDQLFRVIDASQMDNVMKHNLWEVVQTAGKVTLNVLISNVDAIPCDDALKQAVFEILLADSRM
ncbi:putative alpha-xylosidase [Kockovaella imperatae]|uniref:Putative alpha-xylosidase n=1 Tax=Kockovaella imperatae TaxID=4999 RepID=A0A1Y1UND3_9TREE|nr:putative alpha-xylosidase [Kockovaella imperatae]ORX39568.1 putative alpha-xylosidase [Kockovaella imperatae]